MAQEYAKVLKSLNQEIIVIGRGEESASKFEAEIHHSVIRGGLENFLKFSQDEFSGAIITTGIDELATATRQIIEFGINNILVEKPLSFSKQELIGLKDLARLKKARIVIGYNRRFYSSTETAKRMIEEDGGVSSFSFQFTEWSRVIEGTKKSDRIKQNWFLANSSHLVDMAFYLGGKPSVMHSHQSGELYWHKPAKFSGSGLVHNSIPFSYVADWTAPGRWRIEICTTKRKLLFSPLEKLSCETIYPYKLEEISIEDSIDIQFKPGLFEQVKAFLNREKLDSRFCTIDEQIELFDHYSLILGQTLS